MPGQRSPRLPAGSPELSDPPRSFTGMTTWGLTFDCAHPGAQAEFWALALGYVESPPPEGDASWQDWLVRMEVPEEEWDDGAYLCDPAGVGPTISFLKVPESKVAKNRL